MDIKDMFPVERGVIRNVDEFRRILNFQGLRFGNITPTDIDIFLEFGNTTFVIVEVKWIGAEIPFGQKLALERLAMATSITIPTLLVIARHDCSGDGAVEIGECNILEVFIHKDGEWEWETWKHITLRSLIDLFNTLNGRVT